MRWVRWVGAVLLAAGLLIAAVEGMDLSWQNQNLIPSGTRTTAPGYDESWVHLAEGAILMIGGAVLLLRAPSQR